MAEDQRKFRRYTRLLQSESSWLQKAVFALRKVEDARDRMADLTDGEREPFTVEVDGNTIPGDALEDALEARVTDLLATIRERRNRM